MASLRVKPVILGWKSDLTEQHLTLTSAGTHSIYSPPPYLCTNSLKSLQKTFNCPSSDPPLFPRCHPELIFLNQPVSGRTFHAFITPAEPDAGKRLLLLARAASSSLTALGGIHRSFLFSFFFFFLSPTFRREQVPAVTCNGLRRGDWMRPTSSAIKSSGGSFGVPPLRISVQRVFSWGPFRCFSASAKFRCFSQAPVVSNPPTIPPISH